MNFVLYFRQFFNIKYPFKFQCPYIRAISCGTGENRRTSRHLEKTWQFLPLIYQWKISITASSSWSKWSFVLKTLTYLKRAICWGKSKGWITINHHSWKWSWKVIFQINWLSVNENFWYQEWILFHHFLHFWNQKALSAAMECSVLWCNVTCAHMYVLVWCIHTCVCARMHVMHALVHAHTVHS